MTCVFWIGIIINNPTDIFQSSPTLPCYFSPSVSPTSRTTSISAISTQQCIPFAGSPGSVLTLKANYTGSLQSFQVPCNISSISVDVIGASGGNEVVSDSIYSGGKGGRVQTNLKVTPGQTIYLMVGGRGTDRVSQSENQVMTGGFNGGGSSSGLSNGAGGGGGSDIRLLESSGTTRDYLSRVVVAGGGGGGSYSCLAMGGNGGYIGSTSSLGVSCADGDGSVPSLPTGGTQISGGTRSCYNIPYVGSQCGFDGQLGVGGNGGGGGGAGGQSQSGGFEYIIYILFHFLPNFLQLC